jgi:hypothetical protein
LFKWLLSTLHVFVFNPSIYCLLEFFFGQQLFVGVGFAPAQHPALRVDRRRYAPDENIRTMREIKLKHSKFHFCVLSLLVGSYYSSSSIARPMPIDVPAQPAAAPERDATSSTRTSSVTSRIEGVFFHS